LKTGRVPVLRDGGTGAGCAEACRLAGIEQFSGQMFPQTSLQDAMHEITGC
jgi:hypothetical protein